MNYRRWLIVGYMLALMLFTTSVLLIPGQKYDTLTTSDSGWIYDIAVIQNKTNALAENNPLSHAPYGMSISPTSEQVQPLIAVMIYRGVSALNPSVTLMDVVRYWAPMIFALSLIPIFLIGRELGGDMGGVAAAFFAAAMVSTIYWNKVGSFDTDCIELILGAWAMYLTIKLFKASRNSIPKFALLAGMVYGLFGLAWAGWSYVIAILVLGVLFVFLAGFLGRFSRKTSDLLGAFFSTIRGHLDVLAGAVGIGVVITFVMWALGGQGPGFWVNIFGVFAGYFGIGGGGVSFTSYATEMTPPSSWGETLGSFYGSSFPAIILTAFILTLVILAFLKFCWSRKRWEILTFAWLVVLAAMVWPGKGEARFERMWWPFVPALAGVGATTLISLVRRLSLEHYGEHLKHFQSPIALLLVASIVVVPFGYNAYTNANQTTPPTEIVSGLDQGFMEAFAWLRENTPENSIVSIQWSFGHLLTGVAQRPTVCDGAEVRAEEGTWENNPSFVPRPPDYIYYVEGNSAYIYGVDVSRRSFQINGRRIDVQWLPMVGENEFRWIIQTYRDNYGVKIDYVVFSIDEYYNAYNYYSSTQPMSILLSAERIDTPSSLQPSSENTNYVFNFGENRSAVVLDTHDQYVYLRTDNGNLGMDGYAVVEVDNSGYISKYDGFYQPYYTPDIQETLLVILNSGASSFRTAWLIKGVSADMAARVIPIGVNIFGGENITCLQVVFTSSNSTVKIMKIDHAPYLISPENGGLTNDNTPDFSWDTIGSSRYELEVDNDPSFSSPLIHEDNITSTTYTATVALQDGEYYWRVASYDSMNNLLGWSNTSTFTVDTTPPSPPLLSGPQNGTVLSTLNATFQWTQPEQGVKYEIQIDNDNSFPTPYVDVSTGLTDNSYAHTFGKNGTYYWHVRATDAAGNVGEWSDTFALIIRAPPQAPALSSPENGGLTNDNAPTLKWTGGNGDNYRLLLGTNPDLSSPTLDVSLAPSVTSYTIPEENALLDGKYYWKVAAVVGSDENSSDIWTFTVDTVPPEAPVLYAPENGTETGDNTPKFEWSLSPGADNYHLIVDNDIAFGSPKIDVWLVENTYTPTTGLPAENYYWKVADKDVAGNKNESSIWTFRIVSPGG